MADNNNECFANYEVTPKPPCKVPFKVHTNSITGGCKPDAATEADLIWIKRVIPGSTKELVFPCTINNGKFQTTACHIWYSTLYTLDDNCGLVSKVIPEDKYFDDFSLNDGVLTIHRNDGFNQSIELPTSFDPFFRTYPLSFGIYGTVTFPGTSSDPVQLSDLSSASCIATERVLFTPSTTPILSKSFNYIVTSNTSVCALSTDPNAQVDYSIFVNDDEVSIGESNGFLGTSYSTGGLPRISNVLTHNAGDNITIDIGIVALTGAVVADVASGFFRIEAVG